MVELIKAVHQLTLVQVMEVVWLLELDYLLKIQNLFNSIQQVFMAQVV
jgi:hypothetical protein